MPLFGEVKIFVGKSRIMYGGGGLTFENFDSVVCAICSDIVMLSLQQCKFADFLFSPPNLNLISVVLVYGDENAFWVGKVLIQFHLCTA